MHSLFENISFGSATDNNGKHENGSSEVNETLCRDNTIPK